MQTDFMIRDGMMKAVETAEIRSSLCTLEEKTVQYRVAAVAVVVQPVVHADLGRGVAEKSASLLRRWCGTR